MVKNRLGAGARRWLLFGLLVALVSLMLTCGGVLLTGTPVPAPAVTLDGARLRAQQIIDQAHPEMAGVTPSEKEYSYGGKDYYSFTYGKDATVEVEGTPFPRSQVIIVTIDKNTGAETVSVSN